MTALDEGTPVVRDADREASAPSREPDVPVTAHRSSPDRTVFVEADNHDGWIASDLTVELEQ